MFCFLVQVVIVGGADGVDLDLADVGLPEVAPVVPQAVVHGIHPGAVGLRGVVAEGHRLAV